MLEHDRSNVACERDRASLVQRMESFGVEVHGDHDRDCSDDDAEA